MYDFTNLSEYNFSWTLLENGRKLQWKLPEQDSQYKSKQVQVLAETIESER
jgi:hypothetical protein